jgi:small subunit ribosomal protein S2
MFKIFNTIGRSINKYLVSVNLIWSILPAGGEPEAPNSLAFWENFCKISLSHTFVGSPCRLLTNACPAQLGLLRQPAEVDKGDMAKTRTKEISLKELLEAGCHFGHQARRWNPKMKPYLYDVREGVHIFDLAKTKEGLEAAQEFLKKAAAEGKVIVLVGTKRQAWSVIVEEAKNAGVPYVNQRWIGGTITNWEQIKKRLDKLAEMKKAREKGEYQKYTKKERLLLDREILLLEKTYGGLSGLEKVPEVLFIVDVKKENVAVKEAIKKGVELVAIVDSDSDPDGIDYVVPANDDAVGSIKFLTIKIAEAIKEGREIFKKKK